MRSLLFAKSWRIVLALLLWVSLLIAASLWLGNSIVPSADLRLFLPQPETPAEHILLEELKEGPGTRLLLGALSGADNTELANVSEQLMEQLRRDPQFVRAENGALHSDEKLQPLITRYRYLLTPKAADFSVTGLQAALQDRLQELASPVGGMAQDWLLRDPSGALQQLIEAWQGTHTPQLIDGVWFDSTSKRALFIVQTRAAGFDAAPQHQALDAINAALQQANTTGNIHLEVTGPGAFTALMESSIRSDVTNLSVAEGVASFCFLFAVLWSLRHVLLGSLILASAGVVALLGVMVLFPSVHGITLAFGFTLLGVAMDYPVHLMLHLRRDEAVSVTAHHVWPTLRLSILTTCIAYTSLALAGFSGLAQLGVFTTCGLIATGLLIRFVLPLLVDAQQARTIPKWVAYVQHAPRMRLLPPIVLLVSLIAMYASPHPLWNNELSGLTPLPASLQQLDEQLRNELGAPDLRYVLAIRATDEQTALQRDEQLRPSLDAWIKRGMIGGYEQASQLLPSAAQQVARQHALPTRETLAKTLHTASVDLPFNGDVFTQFLNDVDTSRSLPPLDRAAFADTALAERLNALLFNTHDETIALVLLSQVGDAAALAEQVSQLDELYVGVNNKRPLPPRGGETERGGLSTAVPALSPSPLLLPHQGGGEIRSDAAQSLLLLDLKATSESLVQRFRERALMALGLALIVIAALMLWQLTWRESLAVLVPVLATLCAEVALLNALGIALTLFHIVSLLLVGGLCFDYGLFFNRSEASDEEALRTRYAVMACWLSTTGSFALLMISSLPVLFAIGSTVAAGVTLGFFIALLARRDTATSATAMTIHS